MVLIVFGGLVGLWQIDKEVFPQFRPHQVWVTAIYPGAGPQEVEEAVRIPIEKAVQSLPGVKRLITEVGVGDVSEDECLVKVEVQASHDVQAVMSAVRSQVQTIPELPKAVEKIEVRQAWRKGDDGVIWVALHGPSAMLTLKRIGERIEEDLSLIPGVTRTDNYGHVPEIAIQISSAKLHQYQLALKDVAQAVRKTSLDLSGGVVKSPTDELLLRATGKRRDGKSFEQLILRAYPDGTRVCLRDVATITDGLAEQWFEWHHDGETGQGWEIDAEKNTVAVARRVKAYVADRASRLPEDLKLTTWWDDSQAFDERIGTLMEDAVAGFVLVYLALILFQSLEPDVTLDTFSAELSLPPRYTVQRDPARADPPPYGFSNSF